MTTLFQALLSRETVAIAVMLAVLLARLLLRKVPKRLTILLWAVVCFRLLCPLAPEASVSLIPQEAMSVSSAVARIEPSHALEDLAAEMNAPHVIHVGRQAYTSHQWRLLLWELSAFLWVFGAAGLLLSQLRKLLRLKKALRAAQKLEPGVFVSSQLKSAFVLGLFRPVIYLPAGLSAQEQRYVLLHEKTHIKRLDHVWKLLALLCLCIHWFDPVVWLCFGLFGRDVELACDEASTGALSLAERCDYAQTLLRLSSRSPLSPLPAFSEPEPETRIRRMICWKKPAKILCALALVFTLLLAIGLSVNPFSKNIFAQRYRVSACLYENPSFNSTYREDLFSSFALTEDHALYLQQSDGSFRASGNLEEIALSKNEVLSLFEQDWLEPSVRAKLSRVTSGWITRGTNGQVPFFLFMPSGKTLLLAFGYGLGSDAPFVRWLFELAPDTENSIDISALAASIRGSGVFLPGDTVRVYAVYESDRLPGLILAAFDGTRWGEADFYRDDVLGFTPYSIWVDNDCQALASWTSAKDGMKIPYSVVTSHREDLAEVRAVWDGVELTTPVTACPAMVVLEWPEELSSHEDTSPDIRFYDAAGNEIPRE